MHASLADRLDTVLPQTQCSRCGFAGCRPYAEAIARGEADVNQCPPGGESTMQRLAALSGRRPRPLDAARGAGGPRLLALIDEARCIGCTLCIAACPLDAIIGAPRRMHVVMPSLCSGCERCVAPCPVDCIAIVASPLDWSAADANAARARCRARERRLGEPERVQARARDERDAPRSEQARRKAVVAQALARARERRAGGVTGGS